MAQNGLGQPIGEAVVGWQPPPRPQAVTLEGTHGRLVPLTTAHADTLYAAFAADVDGRMWTYLPYGPFEDVAEVAEHVALLCARDDAVFFAVEDLRGEACGVASYLRIAPEMGSIEVGHVCYAPRLQRTALGTEAMFLMTDHALGLGYRRYEWKCDALNAASRQAAERLGFRFEGVFRQAAIYKGRNRDTAWFAIVDREWPALRDALRRWLHEDNFDAQGRQRRALAALRA